MNNPSEILLQVLLALAAVIALGQLLARLLRHLGQPPVIGEVLAGILLGPSLLGPEISAVILPPVVAPHLQVIAQLGVVLYMFTVGLELNLGKLRQQAVPVLVISLSGMVLPFALGLLLAQQLVAGFSGAGVSPLAFTLFLGVAMSVTAFPVLARILTDRGLQRSALGELALSTAALADVFAWCLLAFVVGIATAQPGGGTGVALSALSYLAAMFLLARPALRWASRRWDHVPEHATAAAAPFVFVGLLLSAVATESIGIHAMFGAFLFGALIPHDSRLADTLQTQLRSVVVVLLLPAFFAYSGMRTRIDLVDGSEEWLVCGLIVLIATLGKFGGTWAAARAMKQTPRDAVALGVLMNTRGLMELIVLNIGLDLGVISPTLYSMFVIMALVTTLATGPLLRRLMPAPVSSASRTSAP